MMKVGDGDILAAIYQFLKNHLVNLSDRQAGQILRAWHTACIQHDGQVRRADNGPYLIHPTKVAQLARDFGLSVNAEVAALLHNPIEDGRITRHKLKQAFGSQVAFMVHSLTKHPSQDDQDYFSQITTASSKMWEIVVVKVLDRLHNLTDPYGANTEREKKMLLETIGTFQKMCVDCRRFVPRDSRDDYNDLVGQVINLATKRLAETEQSTSTLTTAPLP